MKKYYYNQFLFSEAYLQEITQLEVDPKIQSSLKSVIDYYQWAERASLNRWNDSFIHRILRALEFSVESKNDNLAVLKQHDGNNIPLGLCYSIMPDEDVDSTLMGRNYAYEIISAMAEFGLTWGILTNGAKWRIYHKDEPTPYENYLEIDLESIIKNNNIQAFQLMFFFFKVQNFIVYEGKCQFDIFKQESIDKVAYIEDELINSLKQREEGGEGILSDICYGYVKYLNRNVGSDFFDEDLRKTIYGGALLYMFRLLFIFYADARGLLDVNEISELQNILKKINDDFNYQRFEDNKYEIWLGLRRIFGQIDNTYNGGLFNREENDFTRFIEETRIADSFLTNAIYNLTHFEDKDKKVKSISFRDMNVRHLGTMYEGLLEHNLFIAEEDTEVRTTKKQIEFIPESKGGKLIEGKYIHKGQVFFGTEMDQRKATGSYYTPEYIVDFIVKNTIDEKLKELECLFNENIRQLRQDMDVALNDSERLNIQKLIIMEMEKFINGEILNLSVLDPAMGSGHFLVNATNHISNFITSFLNKIEINADIETNTNFWRRRVVENCIFGVDLNILAVELAKLSLWILSMAKDKPLSFLNHTLKVGNSLIGTRLNLLGKYPFSKSNMDKDLFSQDKDFKEAVSTVLSEYDKIRHVDSNIRNDIQEKKDHLDKIDKLLIPYKDLCNLHTSLYFDNNLSEDDYINYIEKKKSYSINPDNKWFHWELEYPVILLNKKGFKCIIGNPPWGASLDNHQKNYVKKYFISAKSDGESESSINTFSLLIEQGLKLVNSNSFYFSFILPLSFASTNSMKKIHRILFSESSKIQVNFFSERPGRVFPEVEQPVTILTASRDQRTSYCDYFGTEFLKFKTADLPRILNSIETQSIPGDYFRYGKLPKIGNAISLSILKKINGHKAQITDYFDFNGIVGGSNSIYYKNTGGRYYKPFTTYYQGLVVNGKEKLSSTQSILQVYDSAMLRPINAILNSTTFFWIYQVYSDCWHLNPDDFSFFKFDNERLTSSDMNQLSHLEEELMDNFKSNSKSKINDRSSGYTEYQEIYAREGKAIIDEIDIILSRIYDLNNEGNPSG